MIVARRGQYIQFVRSKGALAAVRRGGTTREIVLFVRGDGATAQSMTNAIKFRDDADRLGGIQLNLQGFKDLLKDWTDLQLKE